MHIYIYRDITIIGVIVKKPLDSWGALSDEVDDFLYARAENNSQLSNVIQWTCLSCFKGKQIIFLYISEWTDKVFGGGLRFTLYASPAYKLYVFDIRLYIGAPYAV